jgi:hypothetical protein
MTNTTQQAIAKMNELLSHSDDYAPIDYNGNLQDEADANTQYIVDISADEQERHHNASKNEMMVIMDTDGSSTYFATTINPWW